MHYLPTCVNFLVLCAVLFYYGRKPLLDFLKNRSKDIDEKIAQASAELTKAQGEFEIWKHKLDSLEKHILDLERERDLTLQRIQDRSEIAVQAERERLSLETRLAESSEFSKTKRDLENYLIRKSLEEAKKKVKADWSSSDQVKALNLLEESLGQKRRLA